MSEYDTNRLHPYPSRPIHFGSRRQTPDSTRCCEDTYIYAGRNARDSESMYTANVG